MIFSDEWLVNPAIGAAGNSSGGVKVDVIEGMDSIDRIQVVGVFASDISVRAGSAEHGLTGIGIYAKGVLEALYTGGDLSVDQVYAMTSGYEAPV